MNISLFPEEHATGNPGSSCYSIPVKSKHKQVHCPDSPKSHAAKV